MKTPTEWFADKISHGGLVSKKQFNELLNQAKERERLNIIDCFIDVSTQLIHFTDDFQKQLDGIKEAAEDYYNEKFTL